MRAALNWISLSCCIALLSYPALADVKGSVFESKGGASPYLVWDATPAVIDIVNAKQPRDAALHDLEATAIDVLAEREPKLTDAKRITVRAIYQKIGAVNPQYGTGSLAGFEKIFELSADASAIRTEHKALSASLAAGNVPADVHLVVSGVLPPL